MFLVFWFIVGVFWPILGKLSGEKICFDLGIVTIALTPFPCFLGNLQGTLPKKGIFLKSASNNFDLG